MQYAIYDAALPEKNQKLRGISAMYLSWELIRHNIDEVCLNKADIILVTAQSPEATSAVATIRNRYPNKLLISGGGFSASPYSIGLYSDAVCVGDGQVFLDTLIMSGCDAAFSLPNVWIEGETRQVEIDNNFPWNMPPVMAEDGAYRLFAGHGCRKKCLFCPTGWSYKYSENKDPAKLIADAKYLKSSGKKIAYITNDLAQHKFYYDLPNTEHGSYSVDFIKHTGLPKARQVRIGVEGVSERIRKYVNKPILHKELVECTSWLNRNHKSVRWFMVCGLPGETDNDWMELRQALQDWKMITPVGVLGVSFTAFCPFACLPFSKLPIDDDYHNRVMDFREWFFSGQGFSTRIKLMFPQAPASRMKRAELCMGLTEEQLREGGHTSPNMRVNYPYEHKLSGLRERMSTAFP